MNNLIPLLITSGLLIISNIFMTFAWYGHLKFKEYPIYAVILVSWGIALVEYAFQVPANRFGHRYFSAVELKALQEVITLLVFVTFSTFYLGEGIRWNHYLGLTLIGCGAYAVFYK